MSEDSSTPRFRMGLGLLFASLCLACLGALMAGIALTDLLSGASEVADLAAPVG